MYKMNFYHSPPSRYLVRSLVVYKDSSIRFEQQHFFVSFSSSQSQLSLRYAFCYALRFSLNKIVCIHSLQQRFGAIFSSACVLSFA